MRDEKRKKQILARLNRLNGQIGGISKMVGNGGECRDVIQQVKAARSALDVGVVVFPCDSPRTVEAVAHESFDLVRASAPTIRRLRERATSTTANARTPPLKRRTPRLDPSPLPPVAE